MSSNLYLFLPVKQSGSIDLESATLSWVYEDVNNELKLAQGLLSDAATAAAQKTVTIVVPGEDVLFLTAEVPGKNIQRIQQAIPFVLEDSVIDDVDDLHFAIKKSNSESSDNQYDVSVINKEYFESTIKQLESAGIQADAMIADYSLIAENTSLFCDGERILFNGLKVKFSSAIDSVTYLDAETFSSEESLSLIDCNETGNENQALTNLLENIDASKELCELHPLLYLVRNDSNKNINLLQGTYKKKKNWSQAGKTWLPVSILFLAWLVVQGGLFVFDYIALSKQNKLLKNEITNIYKRTFPKSRRVIDAKAQMQQKLASLKKRKGQSGRGFSAMLSASASIFSRTKGLVIKSLRYYDGRINLEIQISSLQALDNLKEKLNKEKGYQVEIQNASSGKDTVTARLQIIGAKS